MKSNIGYYDLVTIPGRRRAIGEGAVYRFARMDQTAFRQFLDKAVAFIVGRIAVGWIRPILERQVSEMVPVGLSGQRLEMRPTARKKLGIDLENCYGIKKLET